MKQLTGAIFIAAALFFASPVMASPGHGHDDEDGHEAISATDAGNRAAKKIQKLIKAGKIDASWSTIKVNNTEQKSFSKGPEWVVSFNNTSITDTKKQTLYFFYSLDGHYIAANYSGK